MEFPDASSSEPMIIENDPDTMLLCSTSGKADQRMISALSRHNPVVPVDNLAALAEALEVRPHARALILYDSAINRLIECDHTQENMPSTVLAEWSAQIREVLAFQTRNRRRVLMVEARSALVYTDVFIARLGLDPASAGDLASIPRGEIDPVMLSLAQACLQADPDSRRLAATLQAVATDLSNNAPDPGNELETAVAHYSRAKLMEMELRAELERQFLQKTELTTELESLQESNITLKRDFTAVQDASDEREAALRADLQRQRSTQNTLEEQLRSALEKLSTQTGKLQKSTAEVTLQRDEVSRQRKAISTLTVERDQMRAGLQKLQEDLDSEIRRRKNVAADLHKSGQRVTSLEAETRAQGNELDRLRRNHAEITTERDNLRVRVEDGEEDLEIQYRRQHTLKSALEDATQHLDALKAEAEARAAEVARLTHERAEFHSRLKDTEHWLHGILASRSYRIMAPLRRLRAAFKRNG